MKIIVDTSILIDYLRGGKKGKWFIKEIEGDDSLELLLPTIVVFELYSGYSTKSPLIVMKIRNLLKFFQRLELTEEIAKTAGLLYREVTKGLEVPDYIIAASALGINAEVVTLNQKHFAQIPNINLYPLSYI